MKFIINGILILFSLNLHAVEWKKSKLQIKLPEMNNLEFSNRAACANDSNKPTKSIFILIDNLNLGKTLYRFSKNENIDSSSFTTTGIKTYRKTLIQALNIITYKLVSRQLPLLPVDTDHYLTPTKYQDLSRHCNELDHCPEMNTYLKKLWDLSEKMYLNYIPRISKIDNFNSSLHFLKDGVVKKNRVGCYEVKKFSALEAHLYGGKPTKDALSELSNALLNNQDYFSSCSDESKMPSLKVATYQWDVLVTDNREWERLGFDFWNSLKLYLNFLMKDEDYLKQNSGDYAPIIPSVSLSESVVLASNGCGAISPPACNMDFLSKNSMRLFAQDEFKTSIGEIELMKQVPSTLADDLLKSPIVDVNRDILDLKNYEMAHQWTENFFDNFSKVKGFFKLRLLNSAKNLLYISRINPLEFGKSLDNDIETMKSSTQRSEEMKQSFYHLCAEFYVGTHEKWSFLKNDIDNLSKDEQLQSVLSFNKDYAVSSFLDYLDLIRNEVVSRCNRLEKEKFWESHIAVNRSNYKRWYRQEVYQEKPVPFDDSDPSFFKSESGFVTISDHNGVNKTTLSICGSASECARVYLADMFRLRAVSNYLTALVPKSGFPTDANLFNPYSERVACKVYDPWRKTKTSMFEFFVDLSQVGLSTINPMPIYISAKIDPKTPVSFSTLVKDGKVYYDPRFNKDKIHASLILDLGAIAGIPCLISISDTKQPPLTYYAFNGININACNESSKNISTVNDSSDVKTAKTSHSECFTCSLSLVPTVKQVSTAIPVVRPFAFFTYAVINLYKNMSDPENIPKRWEVNPFFVHETFRKYGEIPQNCVRSLSRGDLCLDSRCEEVAAKSVYQNFSTYIESIQADPFGQQTKIKTSSCSQPITLYNDFSMTGCQTRLRPYTQDDFKIPAACKLGAVE